MTDRVLRIGDHVQIDGATLQAATDGGGRTASVVEGGELRVLPDRFRRRLVPAVWYGRARAAMRRPLFAHQVEAAAWIAERLVSKRGAILADEPGLGKTAAAIAAVVASKAIPVLVVCPASVKLNWALELRMCSRPIVVRLVEGISGPLPKAHVLVANYDLLRFREAQLSRYGFRSVIFDEAHALKEPQPGAGHRAAVATRVASRIRRVVALTGSPLINRLPELWRLLHLVSPGEWGTYAEFRARYCTREADGLQDGLVTRRGTVEHLTELRCGVDAVMLRRTKAELMSQLPAKQRVSMLTDLEPQDLHHYRAAERDVVAWLRRLGRGEAALAAARGEAVVRLTMLRHLAARAKLRAAIPRFLHQWKERPERDPLVVFGFHQDVLAGVRILCRRFGLSVATITGADSSEKRAAALERFQCGDADVFVAPLLAAGLGVNLQRASHALVLERLWSRSLCDQAEDRLHRIGQSRAVTIWYLDARGTVDEHVALVMADKEKIIARVVDDYDTAAVAGEEIETVDAVLARLARRSSSR